MGRFILLRLLQSMVLLVIVSLVTFFLIHSAPGGPAILLNPDMGKADAERIMQELGLNDPLPVQYARWLGNVLQGNFGNSYSQTGKAVMSLIAERLPNSLTLGLTALAIAILIAVPAGVISAMRRYSLIDYLVTTISFFGVSVPVFWLGLMLMLVFAVNLKWLPAGGMLTPNLGFELGDRLRYLVLPALVLSTFSMAQLARYTRSSMVTVLGEDYIRTASAKGLASPTVLWTHALKNALIPVVTVIGVLIPQLVSLAAITETVFAWPGIGRLGVEAATTRDYPTVMGITLTVSVMVIASNLITDILYAYLDPRIKLHAD